MPADERPPVQGLDRRVEWLERAFAALDKDVGLIKADQVHLRELMTSRFDALAVSQSRVEGSIATLTTAVQTSTTDPAASPLGRALLEDIGSTATKATEAREIAARVERRMTYGTGVLGVIIFLAGVFGPTIARLVFGLPA